MKKWFGMIFIMGELLTPNMSFLIQDYRLVENFDFQIELVNPDPDIKIITDCQSFINGLHGYVREGDQWVHQWAIPLSEEKCDYLARQTVEWSEAGIDYCLVVDPENQEYKMDRDLSKCL